MLLVENYVKWYRFKIFFLLCKKKFVVYDVNYKCWCYYVLCFMVF